MEVKNIPAPIAWRLVPICALCTTVLGLLIFRGMPEIAVPFIVWSQLFLIAGAIASAYRYRDWMNPLTMVLFVGFVRFIVPWLLISVWGAGDDIAFFSLLGLQGDDWLWGEVLALVGLLGIIVGWFVPIPLFVHRLLGWLSLTGRLKVHAGTLLISGTGMLVGAMALIVFVSLNADFLEVLMTGEFRAVKISEGTGKYFYLSLLTIGTSVVLSSWLYSRGHGIWTTLSPVLSVAALYWVLGGRMRAFTPVAAGLLSVWYARVESKGAWKWLWLGLVSTFVLLPVVLAMGQEYRGGGGISGMIEVLSPSRLMKSYGYILLMDIGQLHSIALATTLPEGELRGKTFLALLWPLTEIFNLGGKSAGVYLIQATIGFGERKWGLHSTFIGDAYLNFGLPWVAVIAIALGALLRGIYSALRYGFLSRVFYSLIVVYLLRMAFESIEKYGEMLTVIAFTLGVLAGADLLHISGRNRSVRVSHSLRGTKE